MSRHVQAVNQSPQNLPAFSQETSYDQQRQRNKQLLLQDQSQTFSLTNNDHRNYPSYQSHSTIQHSISNLNHLQHLFLNSGVHHLDSITHLQNPSLDGLSSSQLLDIAIQDLAQLLGLEVCSSHHLLCCLYDHCVISQNPK